MTSKLYDILKPVALIYLPALGSLYFAIAAIWGLPDSGSVIGTITAIDTFLGAALGISSANYSANGDGKIIFDQQGLKKVDIGGLTAEDILSKKQVTLKAVLEPGTPVPPAA